MIRRNLISSADKNVKIQKENCSLLGKFRVRINLVEAKSIRRERSVCGKNERLVSNRKQTILKPHGASEYNSTSISNTKYFGKLANCQLAEVNGLFRF